MDKIKTSVVFLSTGRTGTMYFAQTLERLIPQADVYHEAGERSRLINILTHAHLSGMLPFSIPYWRWRGIIGKDLLNCQKEIYIDSNNHIYGLVSIKPEIYPNLKVVHIVRDPRSYVRSHLNWSRYRVKSFIAAHFVPFWQPNAFLLKEMSFTEWLFQSRFEKFCWIWDFKNRLIEKIQDSHTPYIRVKFEDIFYGNDPKDRLNQIMGFLGLPFVEESEHLFEGRINPGKKGTFPNWTSWSNEDCLRLYGICGVTMKEYGYGGESEWIEKLNSAARNDHQQE